MLMRTMQMNNPLGQHGAQVHNIQIKPISAKRRTGGAPANIIQAQFHNQGSTAGQSSKSGSTQQPAQNISVGNILNNR